MFTLFLIALDTILCGSALYGGSFEGDLEYYFRENRLMTHLSAFHLVAVALFCWLVYERDALEGETDKPHWQRPVFIWALMALGFLFLAFDEMMMIHEEIDYLIHDLLEMRESGVSDRLDDLVVFAYTFIGLGLMYRYRKGLIPYWESAGGMVAGGVVLSILMGVMDILTNRHDILTHPVIYDWVSTSEDVIKIYAECLLVLAAYSCLKHPPIRESKR
ncbi:MAG: hypothetical protein HQL52_08370 [Magnetococcales bacterium]|nr:hypothetical protein [Magnetococcales bacterium]